MGMTEHVVKLPTLRENHRGRGNLSCLRQRTARHIIRALPPLPLQNRHFVRTHSTKAVQTKQKNQTKAG